MNYVWIALTIDELWDVGNKYYTKTSMALQETLNFPIIQNII